MSIHRYNSGIICKYWSEMFPIHDAQYGDCADFEMRSMDCLEAYGMIKGEEKCKDFISDLKECLLNGKQRQRIKLMRQERMLQYKTGERKEMFAKSPNVDAY